MCWGSQRGQPHVHLMLVAPGDIPRLRGAAMWQQQCWGDTGRPHHEQCVSITTCRCQIRPALHPDTGVFPAGSRDPSLLDKQHPSMAKGWMDPPSSWALPFLQQHGRSQGRAEAKGGTVHFHQGCREGWEPRETKEMAEPSLKSGTCHCQAVPQKCPVMGLPP